MRSAGSASTGRRCGGNTPRSRATSSGRLGGLSARNAGRPVHQSQGAGALARARDRWHEVAQAYRDVNDMFGDIVKVTPSSKVVGDMALMMVSQNLTPADVVDPDREIAFPASVVEMLHGDLGQPPGGWPADCRAKVLKGETPINVRPGALLKDDRSRCRTGEGREGLRTADQRRGTRRPISCIPKVFTEFVVAAAQIRPGLRAADAGVLLRHAAATRSVHRDRAWQDARRPAHDHRRDGRGRPGSRSFSSSTASRATIKVPNRTAVATRPRAPQGGGGQRDHIAAPMPGAVSTVAVKPSRR